MHKQLRVLYPLDELSIIIQYFTLKHTLSYINLATYFNLY